MASSKLAGEGELRFAWSSNLIEMGRAAKGEILAISALPEAGPPFVELVKDSFNLRPGMVVTIELPSGFTERKRNDLHS